MFRPLENQPPGAGTPKVQGLATATGPDFNQQRLVCTPLFHISGVMGVDFEPEADHALKLLYTIYCFKK